MLTETISLYLQFHKQLLTIDPYDIYNLVELKQHIKVIHLWW